MRSLVLRRAFAAWPITITLLVSLSACASASQPAPVATISAAALPADWQQIQIPDATLALPPAWAPVAPDTLDLSESITAMAAENPDLQAALEQGRAELTAGQVQLIAYDLVPDNLGDTGFPTNLRIGRQTYPDAPDPQEVADVNEQDLRATAGFSDIQRTPVTIGDTPATRLTSILAVKNDVGPLRLAIEQYIIVIGPDVFVLTFTTPQDKHAMYRPTFDQILATLRVTSAS